MPYKKPKIEKVFYSVGEVAAMFDVNPSLIRYWEGEFKMLKPQRNGNQNRLFSKDDVETFRLIFHLVKEQGMTLKGAQKKLKENREETINNFEIVKKLQSIREQLVEIRDTMEE